MNIGQFLQSLVAWLQRWLHSIKKKTPQPFVSVREKQYPLGLLKLVEGRDTSHAIRTWIISPTEVKQGMEALDIHIYLDFIGATSESMPAHNPRPRGTTHTITILRASRSLQHNGTYRYDHIFSSHYDFQSQCMTPADVQARIACDRIAVLAGMRPIRDEGWHDELEEIYRQVMGQDGLPHTQAFKFWRKSSSPRSINLPSSKTRTRPPASGKNPSSRRSKAHRYSINTARNKARLGKRPQRSP